MAGGMGGMLARASERTPQANKALHASGFHQHLFRLWPSGRMAYHALLRVDACWRVGLPAAAPFAVLQTRPAGLPARRIGAKRAWQIPQKPAIG